MFWNGIVNGFNTVILIFGLQHPEMNIITDVFSYYKVLQTQRVSQDGCLIIRTMNKTNSALNTSIQLELS